jgi:hypothetical protein
MYSMPSGNVGVGTSSPTTKLDVNGQLRVRGGSPGAGKVLTSDAAGLASWQEPTDGNDGDWTLSGNDIYSSASGNVGIGTTDPGSKLEVAGFTVEDVGLSIIKATNTGRGLAVYGKSKEGTAVFGEAERNTGVYGWSREHTGVNGTSLSGSGVKGISDTHWGVYGVSVLGTGGVGGGSSTGEGVHGESDSSYGVYGESTNSYGVYGKSSNTTGIFGEGSGSGKAGVYGVNHDGYGVHGASNSGYAGYFSGNVYVTGEVSAQDVTDRTPYPKDAATAYEAVMSMERLPDGEYDPSDTGHQLNHPKLSDFVRSEDGRRNLSATVSAHNEVLKDLIRRVEEQERLIDKQNKQIVRLVEALETAMKQQQFGPVKEM